MEIKSRIIQEATLLFFRYGLKSVTMDDISRELGISKKTLYQYVENKTDLINHIISVCVEEEQEAIISIRENSKDAIHELLMIAKHVTQQLREMTPMVMYDLQKYYRHAWKLLDQFHQVHIYQEIRSNIERGVKEGLYRVDLDSDILAKLYVGKTSLIVDEDLFPLKKYNKEYLFKQSFAYHIHGIASPKGLELLEKHTNNQS